MTADLEPITESDLADLLDLFREAKLSTWEQLLERVRREQEEDAAAASRETGRNDAA